MGNSSVNCFKSQAHSVPKSPDNETRVPTNSPNSGSPSEITMRAPDNSPNSSSPERGQGSGSSPAATGSISVQEFEYQVLADATDNFSNMIREGYFGPVFRGQLNGEEITVKQLAPSQQGEQQFDIEIQRCLHHPNVVTLRGFCTHHDQHLLLVYPSMQPLCNHIYDFPTRDQQPLDWNTRMEISLGIAMGISYLHEMNLACIELNSSNILLREDYVPIISEFGPPRDQEIRVHRRITSTIHYQAPEYNYKRTRNFMSDIYSFGAVLLEIVSGRRVYDPKLPSEQHSLVEWADALRDINNWQALADPLLQGVFPHEGLHDVLGIVESCLKHDPHQRITIKDIISGLRILVKLEPYEPQATADHSSHEDKGKGKVDDTERHRRRRDTLSRRQGISIRSTPSPPPLSTTSSTPSSSPPSSLSNIQGEASSSGAGGPGRPNP